MKEDGIEQNRVMPGVLDGEKFNLFMMKEPAFFMKMMLTYGNLETRYNQEKVCCYFKT